MMTKERFCEICEEAGLIKKQDTALYSDDRPDPSLWWYEYNGVELAEFDEANERAIVIMEFSIMRDGKILELFSSRKIISDDETKLRNAISMSIQKYKELVKSIRRKKIDEL